MECGLTRAVNSLGRRKPVSALRRKMLSLLVGDGIE